MKWWNLVKNWVVYIRQPEIKKALLKRTADSLEKLGIAGIALAVFQEKNEGVYWGAFFIMISYICTILEAKK